MKMLTTAFAFATILLAGAVFVLSGCMIPAVDSYKKNEPKLDIFSYFNGTLEAWGTIHDLSGKLVNTFTASVTGKVEGDVLTLTEHFIFDDGKEEDRIWTITRKDSHHFNATAHDVVGTAQGEQFGNVVNMKYVLKRKIGKRELEFNMDDWMYLVTDDLLINKTSMRKLGVPVAELTIGFRKISK